MHVDWARVYRSTFPDLVRYLYRKVWDADRARDLAQEAFARSLDRAPADPRSWVFTLAANLARDEARTQIRRRRHLTLVRSETVSDPPPADALRQLERREAAERARSALARLTERDREALLLWDAGSSYQEIAERTGLAPGAVGTTLFRARKRLVEAYEAEETKHAARG
ncbi:MAG TPA: sigma-70 family RNA polymerase sigma factor [Thermoanaerobaculia bacterium]|nr:sigma-70 family RNA polymerase sigma factor [Thermoanaerobaculia bacterium]